jgi:NAD(P)-dependent dehydrogenase (short-subunit alcohol dehydrogenase family)
MSSVLITGASKGIGRATAVELAQRGHRVIATARDPRALADLDVAARLRLDVTDQASVDAAVAEAGEIDVLVNNAGIMSMGDVESTPIDEVERLLHHNTIGAIRVTRAVLAQMRRRRSGRLVFLSSILGRTVLPAFAAYSASKWAIEAYGEALAMELGRFEIDVVLAEPGPVSSGLLEGLEHFALPDDPYGITSPITPEITIATGEVATALADLVEADEVPLRSPVGAFTTSVLARRDTEPFDRPFLLG